MTPLLIVVSVIILLHETVAAVSCQHDFYPYVVNFSAPTLELPNIPQCSRSGTTLSCNITITEKIQDQDGVDKLSYQMNDLCIGPDLHVALNDEVNINVINGLDTDTLSIHWHGLLQNDNSFWNDGVAYVTQFPVPPGTSYKYKFIATEIGTQWYHSHSGPQYADGMFGGLIIHNPDDENIYPEFVIKLNEWFHQTAYQIVADLADDLYPEYFPDWTSGLINGNGRYDCTLNTCITCDSYHNLSTFHVNSSQTYRIRIIGSMSGYTLIFSIDEHNMTVIAADGVNIEPFEVQTLTVYVAQRYDILVTMNQPPANYWIRANTLNHQDSDDQQILAILHYTDPSVPVPTNDNTGSNEPTSTRWGSDSLGTNMSTPMIDAEDTPLPSEYEEVVIELTCSSTSFHCSINNSQFEIPSFPLGFSVYEDKEITSEGLIINIEGGSKGILLIINNIGNMSHPFHLHGHRFWVLGNGMDGDGNFDMSTMSNQLNFVNPTLRDTQQMDSRTWMVLLFEPDNPGVWFFHCHIEWHMEAGLALAFVESKSRIGPPPSFTPYFTTYEDVCTSESSRFAVPIVQIISIMVGGMMTTLLLLIE